MGTFHDTIHFQLLSGIRLGYRKNIYDSIYLPIAVFISVIAITSAYTKVVLVLGLLSWYKEENFTIKTKVDDNKHETTTIEHKKCCVRVLANV